jgi:hypothetical protein
VQADRPKHGISSALEVAPRAASNGNKPGHGAARRKLPKRLETTGSPLTEMAMGTWIGGWAWVAA